MNTAPVNNSPLLHPGWRARTEVEYRIENIARSPILPFESETRFVGKNRRTAPVKLAIPRGGRGRVIAVAARAFDSTGHKLTDAVRKVE